MPSDESTRAEVFRHKARKFLLIILAARLPSAFNTFCLLLLIFFNLQTFGEGIDFCFDGSNEGYRLNGTVIEHIHANSGPECAMICAGKNGCRSINFEKLQSCGETENCELLAYDDLQTANLIKYDNFDHYILIDCNGKPLDPPTPSNLSAAIQLPASSCKELLAKNSPLPNGAYKLQVKSGSLEEYDVYCHMDAISGCGEEGWTLVMKIDGNKDDFKYESPYWTNKATYVTEDGLEGLTEKQTKLASYWNTPFNKICLGMKVNNQTRWIALDYAASSLHNVIGDGGFNETSAGREAWESLINGSALQEYCNQEGFSIKKAFNSETFSTYLQVRIGLVANNQNDCDSCDSCIGFGTSAGCNNDIRSTTCGNMAICNNFNNKNTSAFGFILVH